MDVNTKQFFVSQTLNILTPWPDYNIKISIKEIKFKMETSYK